MSRTSLFLLVLGLGACSTPTNVSDAMVPDAASVDAPFDGASTGDAMADRVAVVDVVAAPQDVAMAANDVPAGDVPASDVFAADVPATDVPATDVPARDVSARDVLPSDAVFADASGNDVPADAGERIPPDFMLPDLNPGSRTHQMVVRPSAQRGAISVWYFASAT